MWKNWFRERYVRVEPIQLSNLAPYLSFQTREKQVACEKMTCQQVIQVWKMIEHRSKEVWCRNKFTLPQEGILQYFGEERESHLPRNSYRENADHVLKEIWFTSRALCKGLLGGSVVPTEPALSYLGNSELTLLNRDWWRLVSHCRVRTHFTPTSTLLCHLWVVTSWSDSTWDMERDQKQSCKYSSSEKTGGTGMTKLSRVQKNAGIPSEWSERWGWTEEGSVSIPWNYQDGLFP